MNTATRPNLTKLKKCNQIWTDMPKNERGRLCLKCQNTIIDFRDKSDSEIAEIHLFTEGKVCGLNNKEQFEIPKRKRKTKKLILWKSIYIGLFSLISFKSFGQLEEDNTVKTEQLVKDSDLYSKQKIDQPDKPKSETNSDSLYISGIVRDHDDGSAKRIVTKHNEVENEGGVLRTKSKG